jgi:hypothetical protein
MLNAKERSLFGLKCEEKAKYLTLWEKTVSIKITALRDVMPCSLVDSYQRFGGTCCLHFQGRSSILKMEPAVDIKIFNL